MDKKINLEQNLLALSKNNPDLSSRISGVEIRQNNYIFQESRSTDIVPSWLTPGSSLPLHSMVDPHREAKRLMDSIKEEGFIILLGLGGGYYAEAALEHKKIGLVLALDFNISSIKELFCSKDYTKILSDNRFHLIIDAAEYEIENFILRFYQPLLYGGIQTLPLRARIQGDNDVFTKTRLTIEASIKKVSADLSVQSYFGSRWFSNILRNLKKAEKNNNILPSIKKAAVIAAGPSLNLQVKSLREKKNDLFIIATDTSLPCLLSNDVCPDAVVSIDCQHISYSHFMGGLPKDTLLFIDLVSPPLIASQSKNIHFFSGNHPLTTYICKTWRPFPMVDTSGGNVTYTSVALAEILGAESIELYGADFSYPLGLSYARGTYIYTCIEFMQKRLASLESYHSALLYRGPLTKITRDTSWYYESQSLKFYRQKLEEKCQVSDFSLIPQEGLGAPIMVSNINKGIKVYKSDYSPKAAATSAENLLLHVKNSIQSLPQPMKDFNYLQLLTDDERIIFNTILPVAATLKRRFPLLNTNDLVERTREYCVNEIIRVLRIID